MSCSRGESWLRSPQFSKPALFAVQAGEIPFSGQALAELMRAVLDRGRPFRFRARGWSMAPFIRDGDVITVAPLEHEIPPIGAVVAFTRPNAGNLVVHRIIARHANGVLMQGDRFSSCADGLVPLDNLLGRVTHIERSGRPIWLGLGPERTLIAWLSRARVLIPRRNGLGAWCKRLSGRA